MRPRSLRVFDLHTSAADFEQEVVSGLSLPQKRLPARFFQDAEGAALVEALRATEEHYLARTELRILRDHMPEIARLIGPRSIVIEPGSASAHRTRALLEALEAPAAYVPVDLSRVQLLTTAAEIAGALPDLEVLPVCADYTQEFPLPGPTAPSGKRAIFFPGSAIGNLDRKEAEGFLRKMAERIGPGGVILLGVDLKKDPIVLHAAYNDAAGIIARLHKNLLVRIAQTLNVDVQLDAFRHYAFYDPKEGRVEMHLVSLRDQTWTIGPSKITFARGESILTETAYKFTRVEVRAAAARAGLTTLAEHVDDRDQFLVVLLGSPA